MSRTIKELIPKIIKQVAKRHKEIHQLQLNWPALIGKELARHTRPVAIRRGRLYVHSDQPGVSFALSLNTTKLLEQIRILAGCHIEEIVIRPGEV